MARPKAQTKAASPAPDPNGYQSNPFELIKPSFEAFKLNWTSYLVFLLSAIGALLAIGLLLAAAIFGFQKAAPLGALATILGVAATAAAILYLPWSFTRLTVASVRGERLALSDSWPELPVAWKFLGTELIYGLIVLAGFVLLVVPGIILSVWFSMTIYIAVEEKVYGLEAMRRSRRLVRGRFWDVLGTQTLPQALGVIGFVPILGALVNLILGVIFIPLKAVRYVQLKQLKILPEPPKIIVSPWNIAVIILAVFVVAVNYYSVISTYNQNQTVEKSSQSY